MILFIIFVILFLILVNAFYVAAEFAAVSVRRNMIREMAEGGSKVAAHLLRILENTKELDRGLPVRHYHFQPDSGCVRPGGTVRLPAPPV